MIENKDFEIEVAAAKPFDQGAPRINGPSVYGASPNCSFLYYVPVRGERPVKWDVEGELPPGLTLNKDNGIISGSAEKEGIWNVTLKAVNRLGTGTKKFRFEIKKNRLALTPLMGWTSWNAFATRVKDEHIYQAATYLCKTGLRDFGYSYVNIDSCWQGQRETGHSALQPNKFFRDMRDLTDHIHAYGLKAGIYSTPMVHAWGTCDNRPVILGSTGYPLNPDYPQAYFGGCGQTHYEKYDAQQWADWNFDYLKYDWSLCDAYYTKYMSDALRATGRDFIFSLTTLCKLEYKETYLECAHMFRANGDTLDDWNNRMKWIIFPIEEWFDFIGPGHWYDMDMLVLGNVFGCSGCMENRLTHNEQVTHMALWAFMASPIQISCDLSCVDPFTMALFTNEELLDINQDELGKGPEIAFSKGDTRIYVRPLANGDYAAAFANIEDKPKKLELKRLGKTLTVRDVLACRDLGEFKEKISFTVPPHGTRVIRFSETK